MSDPAITISDAGIREFWKGVWVVATLATISVVAWKGFDWAKAPYKRDQSMYDAQRARDNWKMDSLKSTRKK